MKNNIRIGDLVEFNDEIKNSGKYGKRAQRMFLVTSFDAIYEGYVVAIRPDGKKKQLNLAFLQKVVDK